MNSDPSLRRRKQVVMAAGVDTLLEFFVLAPGGTLHEMLKQNGFTVLHVNPTFLGAPLGMYQRCDKAVKPTSSNAPFQAALLEDTGQTSWRSVLCNVDKYPSSNIKRCAFAPAQRRGKAHDFPRDFLRQKSDGRFQTHRRI